MTKKSFPVIRLIYALVSSAVFYLFASVVVKVHATHGFVPAMFIGGLMLLLCILAKRH